MFWFALINCVISYFGNKVHFICCNKRLSDGNSFIFIHSITYDRLKSRIVIMPTDILYFKTTNLQFNIQSIKPCDCCPGNIISAVKTQVLAPRGSVTHTPSRLKTNKGACKCFKLSHSNTHRSSELCKAPQYCVPFRGFQV